MLISYYELKVAPTDGASVVDHGAPVVDHRVVAPAHDSVALVQVDNVGRGGSGPGRGPVHELAVPALAQDPAEDGADEHGRQGADAGPGAHVLPLVGVRRDAEAAQVPGDVGRVGAGIGDGGDGDG